MTDIRKTNFHNPATIAITLSGLAGFRRIEHLAFLHNHSITTEPREYAAIQGQKQGRASYYRHQNADASIQESMQALIFGYLFIKKKVRAFPAVRKRKKPDCFGIFKSQQ